MGKQGKHQHHGHRKVQSFRRETSIKTDWYWFHLHLHLHRSAEPSHNMALEVIRSAPQLDAFTPLSEHQSQTPGTFFGGRPILYFHTSNASLSIDAHQLESSPAFSALNAGSDASAGAVNGNGNSNGDSKITITAVDVFVTSE